MSTSMPNRIVAGVRFLGRSAGAVKTLGGFKKGRHTLPDAVNATTNAFLGRLCAGELEGAAEAQFQRVRRALAYRRQDLTLTCASPRAVLTAKDFTFEIHYALDEADPARYAVTQTLLDVREGDLIQAETFNEVFARMFTELSFALRQGARVEAVVDAIEALDGESPMRVDYPSDCRECTIGVAGVEAQVRCTGASLDLVFPRVGAPRELLAEFAAVRSAFQLSKALAGLIG